MASLLIGEERLKKSSKLLILQIQKKEKVSPEKVKSFVLTPNQVEIFQQLFHQTKVSKT